MIVAIHQPNFFPWHPFFEKVAAADVFVLLRHCQWEKGGYQNRFELGGKWRTMAVEQGLGTIAEKRYLTPQVYWNRIKLQCQDFLPVLQRFDECIGESLAATNEAIIRRIARDLGIKTTIIDDVPSEATKTERLVEIVRDCGADTYLSGPSGPHYMDMDQWERAGIKVQVHEATDRRPILEVLRERL